MSRLIPLTKGYSAIVDDEDFEWINTFSWHASKKTWGAFYAARSPDCAYMHRLILGLPKGEHRILLSDADVANRTQALATARSCANASAMS